MSPKPTLTGHPRASLTSITGPINRGRETRDKVPSPSRQPRRQNIPTKVQTTVFRTREKTTTRFSPTAALNRTTQLTITASTNFIGIEIITSKNVEQSLPTFLQWVPN